MDFSVDEPTGLEWMNESPESVCRNGHEECSFRHGGPCYQFECTCETTGNCLSCTPVAGRVP